jgi:lambda repressor-like predicted transcriptional regulator
MTDENHEYGACLTKGEAVAPKGASPDEILVLADALYERRHEAQAACPPTTTHTKGRARGRERRDSTRRSSSRGSPSNDSEGEQAEPGETPGRIIETRLAELGLSYREVCALTEGVVDPSTLSRVITGRVTRPYARTRAAIAWALKMHVTEIWRPRQRRAS